MLPLTLLFIAIGVCIYLYARYRHICQEDNVEQMLDRLDDLYGVSSLPVHTDLDWNFPPKWHPPEGRTTCSTQTLDS